MYLGRSRFLHICQKYNLIPAQPRSKLKNPHQIRLNVYRVLLTRARDGFVIFCPKHSDMGQIYDYLVQCGLEILTEELIQSTPNVYHESMDEDDFEDDFDALEIN